MNKIDLVTSNQGLVHWMAKKYLWTGVPYDDLVQEGNVGLMIAAERFDPDRGFKFSTYATWWVRQKIQRALKQRGHNISLDEQRGESGRRMIDTVAAPEGDRVLDEQNAKHIRRALAILSPSEARVIRFRLALDDVKCIAPDKLRVWLD